MMQSAPNPGHDDAMMAEEAMYDGLEQTQEATQGTCYSSQLPVNVDAHLWGFLQPCTGALSRLDFWKANPVYNIGRNPEGNRIILPGFKVSEYLVFFYASRHLMSWDARPPLTLFSQGNKHCKITWDGKEETRSDVIIQDLSSNGTFVSTLRVPGGTMVCSLSFYLQVNGEKVGKGRTRIIRDGNEIAFGTPQPQPQNDGAEDYRGFRSPRILVARDIY